MMLLKHKNIDFSNIFHYFGAILLFVAAFIMAAMKENQPASSDVVGPANVRMEDSVTTITLGFAGDLMCHVPQMTAAKLPDGSYDFNPAFAEIKSALCAPDIMIGNLELTTAGPSRPYQGYPAFNAPDEYISALTNAGFDFLVTSNNHSMDTGEEGLQRTLKKVREAGMGSTGTFDSQRDRDSIRVLTKNGISVALLNYTYGTNGSYPAASRRYMLNVADSALVRKDVERARALNPDIVVVIYHWGIENIAEPTAKQDSMFHWAADNGADLVIGAHPHVIGPVDYFKTKKNASLDSGVVAWSLGNFMSNQYWRYTDAGLIFNVTIEKNHTSGKKTLKQTDYIPTWVYRGYDPSEKRYFVVPATWCGNDSLPKWMNTESKTKMCEAFGDTKKMMGKYTSAVVLQNPPTNSYTPEAVPEKSSDKQKTARTIIERPDVKNPTDDFGNVCVIVQVNRAGMVVMAEVDPAKTNTSNTTLRSTAVESAYKCRFNACDECAEMVKTNVCFTFNNKDGKED